MDKCGVCRGNNDTCIDIVGIFRPEQIEQAKQYSKTPYYYHVTLVPKGASNIEIHQPGYSDDLNYIGELHVFQIMFNLYYVLILNVKLLFFNWTNIYLPIYINFDRYSALMDDQGGYILNGHNIITQYPISFAYGGVTFDYTGTNSTLEKVNTTFARRIKRDLTIEVI